MGDLFVFFLSSFVILIIVLDQLIKYLVVNNMFLGESIPVIPHLLHLTYILNPGAAAQQLLSRTGPYGRSVP